MKDENRKTKNKYFDEDQDYLTAVSATDCTGLIPAAPQNEDEVTLYDFLNSLSPTQQHAALVHLSVKWAQFHGGQDGRT